MTVQPTDSQKMIQQAEAWVAQDANGQEPVHSRLGPSSAHRWMNCAASVALIAKHGLHEEESSEEAARGTVKHEVAAECLINNMEVWEFAGQVRTHGKWSFEVDGDFDREVNWCLDMVRQKFEQHRAKGAVLYAETKVRSELDPEAYGTADIRIEVPGERIIIMDFKFGMVRCDPDDEQLKLYGYYSYEQRSSFMRGQGEPKVIELYILQPRLPDPKDHMRRHVTNPQELTDFMVKEVLPAMNRTRDPEAKLCIGEWCKFCPLNTSAKCPAMKTEIAALPVDRPADTFTSEEIGRWKSMKPVYERFFTGLDNEAMVRIRDRKETVPGWKLVHKTGNRVFHSSITEEIVDEATGEVKKVTMTPKQILDAKYGEKAYEPASLKSPAQIEKLPGGKLLVAKLAFKPDTGLTLAPVDDTREPAVGLMARAAAGGALVAQDEDI